MLRPGCVEDAAEVANVYLDAWRMHGQELLNSGVCESNAQLPSLGPEVLAEQTNRFATFLRSEARLFFVVEVDIDLHCQQSENCGNQQSRLCGFISYGPSVTRPGFGEVMQLFVHPSWQKRGFGSRLLCAAWQDMMRQPWASAGKHVWCTQGNPANRVYTRVGWSQTGREKTLIPTLTLTPVAVAEYIAPEISPPVPKLKACASSQKWGVRTRAMFTIGLVSAIAVAIVVFVMWSPKATKQSDAATKRI